MFEVKTERRLPKEIKGSEMDFNVLCSPESSASKLSMIFGKTFIDNKTNFSKEMSTKELLSSNFSKGFLDRLQATEQNVNFQSFKTKKNHKKNIKIDKTPKKNKFKAVIPDTGM